MEQIDDSYTKDTDRNLRDTNVKFWQEKKGVNFCQNGQAQTSKSVDEEKCLKEFSIYSYFLSLVYLALCVNFKEVWNDEALNRCGGVPGAGFEFLKKFERWSFEIFGGGPVRASKF